MAQLTFPIDQVKRILEHTKACDEHDPTFEQQFDPALFKEGVGELSDEEIVKQRGEHIDPKKVPAGFLLVKDQGVYLMSNGSPRDIVSTDGDRKTSYLVYAKGCNPEKDEFWYDTAVDRLGGDDFAQFLPVEWLEMAVASGKKSMTIRVNKNSMSLAI